MVNELPSHCGPSMYCIVIRPLWGSGSIGDSSWQDLGHARRCKSSHVTDSIIPSQHDMSFKMESQSKDRRSSPAKHPCVQRPLAVITVLVPSLVMAELSSSHLDLEPHFSAFGYWIGKRYMVSVRVLRGSLAE